MGKGKGSAFEREICKCLTVWLTGNIRPFAFWRMPASGALATIYNDNNEFSGDIIGISPEAKKITDMISFECKTGYPATSFWQHFKHIKGFHIKLFWKQAVEDALKPKKRPMLIYRKKGKQIIIGICRTDKEHLETRSDGLRTLPYISMRFELGELPEVVFFDFKEFFAMVTPEQMQNFQNFLRAFS